MIERTYQAYLKLYEMLTKSNTLPKIKANELDYNSNEDIISSLSYLTYMHKYLAILFVDCSYSTKNEKDEKIKMI